MDKIAKAISDTSSSLKSMVKMALLSKPMDKKYRKEGSGKRILILGNGPALAKDLAEHMDEIKEGPSMEVNFSANAPEFFTIKPAYYILIDPDFFQQPYREVLMRLMDNFKKVDWAMKMFVPMAYLRQMRATIANPHVELIGINPVGVEGWGWLEKWSYSTGLGMPRPRNVLIAGIMAAIALGFKEIYLLGADHSWSRTLWVDDENYVVSVQPHFYKDDPAAVQRSREFFKNVKLHEVMESYAIAFRGYHSIADFAKKKDIRIFNSTEGSFIDAFPRMKPW